MGAISQAEMIRHSTASVIWTRPKHLLKAMPELPDVEIFKRYLDGHALHQTIERITVSDTRILRGVSAEELVARLEGNRIEASERHGKHLLARLAREGWLTLHFGMTGGLVYFGGAAPAPPQERLRFDFE